MNRYPLKEQVERINTTKLAAIPGASQKYVAQDLAGTDGNGRPTPMEQAIRLLDQTKFVPELVLKVGAFVMLLMVSQYCILIRAVLTLPEQHRYGIMQWLHWYVNACLTFRQPR